MKSLLTKAKLWNEDSHAEALTSIIKDCACQAALKPNLNPPISISATSKGEELCLDIVYFEGIPHLHLTDKFSKFSACQLLKNRSMESQVALLQELWLNRYAKPMRITADAEYDKQLFREFCARLEIKLVIIATEAHHQNGTIESGNRVLRMFVRKIKASSPHLSLEQVVGKAVYAKNACLGSKTSSSYELWFGELPSEDASTPSCVRAAFDAKQARMKVHRAIRAAPRPINIVNRGEYVRFYRYRTG
jgi:hypothetical protein